MDDDAPDPMFSPGDVIKREKHERRRRKKEFYYVLMGTERRGGYLKYRWFLYSGHVGNQYKTAGWYRVEYLDELVRRDDENEWVDADTGTHEYYGHVEEIGMLPGTDGRYFNLEVWRSLLAEGAGRFHVDMHLQQTTRPLRLLKIVQLGKGQHDLADDMIRFHVNETDESFVEHESRVMEAVNRGMWIPVFVHGKIISGTKETLISES